MKDYQSAAEYLGKKTDRPLEGRATRLQRRSDSTIAIRYQSTDVITYHADGSIVLESGGWRSATTKARINEYTRARIIQTRGIWYLAAPGSWQPASLYYDGMILGRDGTPRDPKPIAEDASDRQLQRTISTYIKGFAAEITAGKLADPGPGDCWGCLFTAEDAKPDPAERGQITGIDHLISHLEERYYVPSLAWRALVERQYGDPGFVWQITKARKDPYHVTQALRAFFKLRRPALLQAWQARQAAAREAC